MYVFFEAPEHRCVGLVLLFSWAVETIGFEHQNTTFICTVNTSNDNNRK